MPGSENRWSHIVWQFLFWTAIGVLAASQLYFGWRAEGQINGFSQALLRRLPGWWLWFLLSLAIQKLVRVRPLGLSRGWRGVMLFHLPVSFAVALVHEMIRVPIEFMPSYMEQMLKKAPELQYIDVYWGAVLWFLAPAIAVYWAILAVHSANHFHLQLRQTEVQTLHLASQLSEARLTALEMQLQPHFLFNTLHSVAALARSGRTDEVVKVVNGLSELLRKVLASGSGQFVSLAEEMRFVAHYLEIEGMRFHDRLRIDLKIDPQFLDCRVPNLILQPLVENAIRHGISVSPSAGRVEVRAAQIGNQLSLEVRDDGPGPPAVVPGNTPGIGLNNVRQRLLELYGQQASFELISGSKGDQGPGGAVARILIPMQHASAEPSETSR
jgi:signal transduction histidine kinase